MKIETNTRNEEDRDYDRNSLSALLGLTAGSIASLRELLGIHSYLEVSTNSIGARAAAQDDETEQDLYPDSCDKLLVSLFSETQTKLDMLAMSLERNCFHVRQKALTSMELACSSPLEHMLGQQTLVQLEAVYPGIKIEALMDKLIYLAEDLTRNIANELPQRNHLDLRALKVPVSDISDLKEQRFIKITYDQALQACLEDAVPHSQIGANIFKTFGNLPIFVLYPPRTSKQFIFSNFPESNVALAFDLYLPGSGAVVRGGILAESPQMLDENLQIQIPGAKPTGIARKHLRQYKKRIKRSGSMMRGVIELHIEGVLNSMLRNASFTCSKNSGVENLRFPAGIEQSAKKVRRLHVPL